MRKKLTAWIIVTGMALGCFGVVCAKDDEDEELLIEKYEEPILMIDYGVLFPGDSEDYEIKSFLDDEDIDAEAVLRRLRQARSKYFTCHHQETYTVSFLVDFQLPIC